MSVATRRAPRSRAGSLERPHLPGRRSSTNDPFLQSPTWNPLPQMESQTQGRLVVVGASAGGVEALIDLLGVLPPDLGAPVLVVLHRPATGDSTLARVLTRAGGPPAHDAVEGEELEPGRIYVAPPDRHLLVWD